MVMPRKGMALVEMEDVEGAEALVEGAAANPLVLHGRRILCNFSTVGLSVQCLSSPVGLLA